MIGTLVLVTCAVLATPTRTDTVVSVTPGTRLELNDFAGSIAVQTWTKNAVRVGADHSPRAEVQIERSGSTLGIGIVHWRGVPTSVDYQLTVPKWMALDLGGVNTDISVENTEAEVKAESVQGEVTVTGGSKLITANSVEGETRVFRARGKVECSSVNAGVRVEEVVGPVAASSVNGEILLRRIDSDDVEASTVNGAVTYEGLINDGGSYRFSTHGGDVSVVVPERANATISVATYNGDFSSAFPVTLTETRHGKQFSFTLGTGSARIELESFEGDIRLRHPGDPDGKAASEFRYEHAKAKTQGKSKEKHSKDGDHDGNDENDEP
jgi:hypothetical protein